MQLRYFPFDGKPYQPKVGIQKLDPAKWIEIDENWEIDTRRKAQLLADHRDTVLAVSPEGEAGALELRRELASELARLAPARFRWEGETFYVEDRAYAEPRGAEDALAQLATWVQEDWAVLTGEGAPRLAAGVICFPSRWKLRDKLGLPPAQVHAPVPRFDTIAKPTENVLERIQVGFPFWRMNWTIHDSDELHVPEPHPSAPDLTEENILARSFVRFERQTLRRLSESKAVVFSIRTYIHRIAEVAADADRRAKLLGTLETLPPDLIRYKGMGDFYPLLCAALRGAA